MNEDIGSNRSGAKGETNAEVHVHPSKGCTSENYKRAQYGAGHLAVLASWHSRRVSQKWVVFIKTRKLKVY